MPFACAAATALVTASKRGDGRRIGLVPGEGERVHLQPVGGHRRVDPRAAERLDLPRVVVHPDDEAGWRGARERECRAHSRKHQTESPHLSPSRSQIGSLRRAAYGLTVNPSRGSAPRSRRWGFGLRDAQDRSPALIGSAGGLPELEPGARRERDEGRDGLRGRAERPVAVGLDDLECPPVLDEPDRDQSDADQRGLGDAAHACAAGRACASRWRRTPKRRTRRATSSRGCRRRPARGRTRRAAPTSSAIAGGGSRRAGSAQAASATGHEPDRSEREAWVGSEVEPADEGHEDRDQHGEQRQPARRAIAIGNDEARDENARSVSGAITSRSLARARSQCGNQSHEARTSSGAWPAGGPRPRSSGSGGRRRRREPASRPGGRRPSTGRTGSRRGRPAGPSSRARGRPGSAPTRPRCAKQVTRALAAISGNREHEHGGRDDRGRPEERSRRPRPRERGRRGRAPRRA